MRRYSLWDAIISVAAVVAVCAAIVPAVARLQRDPKDAACQANMRRWAGAMRIYAADWDGRYPTNRLNINHALVPQAMLSPQGNDPGNPPRFVYSVNWVEALYPYVISEAQRTGRNWQSIKACSKANTAKWPAYSPTAAMTYAFNYNLLEQPEFIIKDKSRLMLMREMDRVMDAVCRPTNDSTGSSAQAPLSPFLTKADYSMRGIYFNYKLHGEGSYIVFADGHVQYFTSNYFPNADTTTVALSATNCWDAETQQWWNWVNNPKCELNKAIAVTP